MNTGSCLCGKINFKVSKFESAIAHCHCKMCRKFHGAAFSTLAEVKLENLTWLSGKEHLKTYIADNKSQRLFCNNCGASIAFISTYNLDDDTIELSLSCFDHLDFMPKVNAHIFVESKVPWLELNDDIVKYLKFRE